MAQTVINPRDQFLANQTDDVKAWRQYVSDLIQNLEQTDLTVKPYKFIKFFDEGIDSIVALAEIDGVKRVIKGARWHRNVIREANFLKTWKAKGVRTFEVINLYSLPNEQFGEIGLGVYEFIDQPTAFKYFKAHPHDSREATWFEIGRQLGLMHQIKTQGFDKPDFETSTNGEILTWEDYRQIKLPTLESAAPLIKAGFLDLDNAKNIFSDLNKLEGLTSVMAHNDLGLHNVLGHGSNLVVFDPNTKLVHPYLDLATSYTWCLTEENPQSTSAPALLRGYQEFHQIDIELFSLLFRVRCIQKMLNWLLRPNNDFEQQFLPVLAKAIKADSFYL